eukprot:gene1868-2205_t
MLAGVTGASNNTQVEVTCAKASTTSTFYAISLQAAYTVGGICAGSYTTQAVPANVTVVSDRQYVFASGMSGCLGCPEFSCRRPLAAGFVVSVARPGRITFSIADGGLKSGNRTEGSCNVSPGTRVGPLSNSIVAVTCTSLGDSFTPGRYGVVFRATFPEMGPCPAGYNDGYTEWIVASSSPAVLRLEPSYDNQFSASLCASAVTSSLTAKFFLTSANASSVNVTAGSSAANLVCSATPAAFTVSPGSTSESVINVICSLAGGASTGLSAGNYTIFVSAVADGIKCGSQVPAVATASSQVTIEVVAPPFAVSLVAPAAAQRMCFGEPSLMANYTYSVQGSARRTVFDAVVTPGGVCSPGVRGLLGPQNNATVTANCSQAAPYNPGNYTITVSGTYMAAEPCSGQFPLPQAAAATVEVIARPTVTLLPRTPLNGCTPNGRNASASFIVSAAATVGPIAFSWSLNNGAPAIGPCTLR